MPGIVEFSTRTVHDTLAWLESSEEGLRQQQVSERQKQFGLNSMPQVKRRSILLLAFKQFKSVLVGVLLVAASLSFLTGHRTDAIIILVVVFIDASIGFFQEWKAEEALSSLRKMLTPMAKVVRENQMVMLSAAEIVPGDIIVVEEGDYVPADAHLAKEITSKLQTVIHSFSYDPNFTPDLVTSWE